jgi:hypothetical protein
MRTIALAVLTLSLLLWRPAPATTQPLPSGANVQDRDDHRSDQDRGADQRRDNDRHDADHRRDNDGDHDRDADRGHYRDQNNIGRYPRGSYARTCRDIRMEGTNLKASCQKNDSRWRDTSLKHYDTCRGQIINDNGRLRCM